MTKIAISPDQRAHLNALKNQLAQVKLNLQKTPITIDEDLVELEKESEREVKEILAELEKFFAPVTESLNEILHPVKTMEPDIVQESNPKGGKAGAADKKADPKAKAAAPAKGKAPAKGVSADLPAYESTLPLTTSGIESVVILIDNRLETLPFESLEVFDKVPVVSRDFNLHLHM